MKIAVVGLAYAGLPLSLQFAPSCVNVLGIDIDPEKVELLNCRQNYIKHVPQSAIAELAASGKFSASSDFSRIRESKPLSFVFQRRLRKIVSLIFRSFWKRGGRNRAMIENFDLILIATNHSSVNYHELGKWARCNRGYAQRDGGHARFARKSLEA